MPIIARSAPSAPKPLVSAAPTCAGTSATRDGVGHRPDVDELGRVEPGDFGAQSLRGSSRVRRPHEHDRPPLGPLQVGRVNQRPDRFAERPVLAVAHDANHFRAVQAFAERVAIPELPRQRLVHDHDTRRARPVVLGEVPSRQQRNPHRAKPPGAHAVHQDHRTPLVERIGVRAASRVSSRPMSASGTIFARP